MSGASYQLGFEALLHAADAENRAREIERETAHLPSTMEEAIPFFRILLRSHHAAMLAANVDETMRLRREARRLALRLNGGEAGILAGPDAPGCVLDRESAAAPGTVPLWGQSGVFLIEVAGMNVRVGLDGVFGTVSAVSFWPGFAAHAVELERPFLSETGYRSFLGMRAEPEPDLLPDEFVRKVIAAYVSRELKGRLLSVEPRYRALKAA